MSYETLFKLKRKYKFKKFMVIYLRLIDTSHKSRDGKKHKSTKAEMERKAQKQIRKA
jgi:hypothetical protein